MSRNRPIKVVHKAPGKKGKQECRTFRTLDEVAAYLSRNEGQRFAGSVSKRKGLG